MRNRAEIKAEAKQLIRTGRASPLVVTAIVLVVSFVLDRVVSLVEYGTLFPASYMSRYYDLLLSGELYSMDMEDLMALANALPAATLQSTFFSILVSLFMAVLMGGYYLYCMGLRQRVEMPYATLLDGLSVAGRLIWCNILVYIKVFLWSLLFFIPGVVAAYRYRFAVYNVLTDSSLSASEAIRLSCRQTEGIKGELFVLDLSFIGWSILSSFTMGILDIWLQPYVTLCDLAYFEDAQIRLGRSPYGGEMPPPSGPSWDL